uniref:Uncharacterized protein n=1 Tax=Rhizophora mucronata TaxID=61149 RepID=A0A2P2QK53_RHIMU
MIFWIFGYFDSVIAVFCCFDIFMHNHLKLLALI